MDWAVLHAYAVEGDDLEIDRHVLVFGIFSGRGNVVEDVDVVLEGGLSLMQVCEDTVDVLCVAFDFGVQAGLGVMDEVAVMLPFHYAF